MNHEPEKKDRLAVLIDADNAQPSLFEGILEEAASLGLVSLKRIYGDFTSPNSAQWRKILGEFAIRPCQQYAYTKGKNATDGALVIDAMDLLHSKLYDGFCIISSDSDYTSLAIRLRESGLKVYGFGRSNTPDAFKNACDKFIKVELLKATDKEPKEKLPAAEEPSPETGKEIPAKGKAADPTAVTKKKPSSATPAKGKDEDLARFKPFPFEMIRDAIDKVSDDTGWALLSSLGSYLGQIKKDFDPRDYGCRSSKLSTFIEQFSLYLESKRIAPAKGAPEIIYVRLSENFK